MTTSLARAFLLTGLCLFAGSVASGDEPDQTMLTTQVLPTQRTPVLVWPIMRFCKPDKAATSAVVARLSANLALEVHQLAPPADPAFMTCSGASCAELLDSQGCEKRSGIFIGGEIDEETCNPSDASIAGCHGQVVTRLRVYRFDLDGNRPTAGEYRYDLCQDGGCGTESRPVDEWVGRMLEQLVSAPQVASPPAAPRATPLPEEQCTPGAPAPSVAAVAPANAPQAKQTSVAYAYYTQYQHLAGGKTGTSEALYPTAEKAEQEAKDRASHFLDGAALPQGPHHIQTVVNTKYTLLPGETLVGNAPRIGKLASFLTTPPAGAAYDALRADKGPNKAMIILVFDHETKALATYIIEAGKPLRSVSAPQSCQLGSGESKTCVSDSVRLALVGDTAGAATPLQPAVATPLAVAQRPLGCLPFRERSCTAICSAPQQSAVAPLAPTPPPAPPAPPVRSGLRNAADGFLYVALIGSLATAIGLTVTDYTGGPTMLTDAMGDTANINGLLRPAEWVAWGLSAGLAIPTIFSIADRAKHRARSTPAAPLLTVPTAPRCPIGEGP